MGGFIQRKDGEPTACLVIDYKSERAVKKTIRQREFVLGLAIQAIHISHGGRKKFGPVKAGGALYLPTCR